MQCIESLVAHGGDIDQNIHHLGTPLYMACENLQVACAKKLLESGKTKSTAEQGEEMKSAFKVFESSYCCSRGKSVGSGVGQDQSSS